MKQIKVENESVGAKTRQRITLPPVPLPRLWVKNTVTQSITKKEIAKFWRQKRVEEEEHLLAAIKAAARIRARNLSEEDYKLFEESLKDEDNDTKEQKITSLNNIKNDEKKSNEIRVGIKHWWKESNYAYLNQSAIESMDTNPKRQAFSSTQLFLLQAHSSVSYDAWRLLEDNIAVI